MNSFVGKTGYLEIIDQDVSKYEDDFPLFMFFDIDSLKIGIHNIKNTISHRFYPIFISSIYSRDFLKKLLGTEFDNIGYLNKMSNYEDFINEISHIIDNSIS